MLVIPVIPGRTDRTCSHLAIPDYKNDCPGMR